ncbi:transglycosylase family protein [Kitasatospora sp. NPDC057198]|uniref:transglycosylase family protein n=1 Tax=Kitasatospora sp. NPDC057198 TaxID=3346046 RepID=UPI00363B32EE
MLFTGPGRHRRQGPAEKAAERAIAAAGVAGVGIALPLLAVSGAHAAPSAVWDRVAECESGGNWSSDAGNGLYGGLQINAQRWTDYGGTQFAPLPNGATRSQQIAVAERILATEGPSPWSSCVDESGLSTATAPGVVDDNDSADETGSLRGARGIAAVNAAPDGSTVPSGNAAPVFSGLPGYDPVSHVYWYEKNGAWFWTSHQSLYERYMQLSRPQPQPSTSAPTAPTTDPTGAPATPSTPSASPATPLLPTDPTATPSPTAPTDGTNGNGNGNGDPNGTGNNGNGNGNNGNGNGNGLFPTLPATPSPSPSGSTDSSGATGTAAPDASPTSGTATPAPAATPDVPATPAAQAAAPSALPYTVSPGDSLAGIAREHALDGGWSELYKSNQQVVGENPDLIRPGQVLELG